jgi:hypothetical protein
MRRLICVFATMMVFAALVVPPARGQVPMGDGTDRWLKLQWTAGAGHITGRIYNEYVRPADQIRLVVEARDASDNVIAQRYEWVGGVVPALGDRSFDLPVPASADHYRVAVASYTFILSPGRGRRF